LGRRAAAEVAAVHLLGGAEGAPVVGGAADDPGQVLLEHIICGVNEPLAVALVVVTTLGIRDPVARQVVLLQILGLLQKWVNASGGGGAPCGTTGAGLALEGHGIPEGNGLVRGLANIQIWHLL